MRITYFTDTYRIGGAERFLANVVAGAADAGHEVTVVSTQESVLELVADEVTTATLVRVNGRHLGTDVAAGAHRQVRARVPRPGARSEAHASATRSRQQRRLSGLGAVPGRDDRGSFRAGAEVRPEREQRTVVPGRLLSEDRGDRRPARLGFRRRRARGNRLRRETPRRASRNAGRSRRADSVRRSGAVRNDRRRESVTGTPHERERPPRRDGLGGRRGREGAMSCWWMRWHAPVRTSTQ